MSSIRVSSTYVQASYRSELVPLMYTGADDPAFTPLELHVTSELSAIHALRFR